jgi:type I restriction enzyme S subunit
MKNKTSPRIRFSQFIEDWKPVSLKEITLLITKGTTPSYFTEEGIRYIKIESLKNNTVVYSQCLYIDHKTHEGPLKRSILKENDLLFAIAGATIGKCCIVPKESLPANTNQALSIIRLSQHQNNKFVFFNLQSNKMQRYIKDNTSVGAQPNLNLEQIGNFSFHSPVLEEQTKIATFLSAIDEKIERQQRLLTLWQAYKKGIMQQIFSQKLRFKAPNGEDFPKWSTTTLGKIAEFSKGKGISKDDITQTGIPCIRYGQLYTIYNEVIDKVISKTSNTKDLVLSEANDIIIPTSGETAIDIAKACCITISGVAIGGDLTILKTNQNGVFLSYYINNVKKKDISSMAQGISVIHLYSKQLQTLSLELPCIEEQTKIASFLSSLDGKIDHIQRQLTSFREFKKGLLQQMFV